ncbi:hypothetical protein H0G86_006779 [Trichoderma simmonsii]|uniref:Uncharacterized protein n=1 Tax=Trichoderma simmonsii TaxID=1491479 RepID=A0A8G0PHP6_9HYPO|nr:hypothetical protein H0G86_006779 [Trichoderma simmonsii]
MYGILASSPDIPAVIVAVDVEDNLVYLLSSSILSHLRGLFLNSSSLILFLEPQLHALHFRLFSPPHSHSRFSLLFFNAAACSTPVGLARPGKGSPTPLTISS